VRMGGTEITGSHSLLESSSTVTSAIDVIHSMLAGSKADSREADWPT